MNIKTVFPNLSPIERVNSLTSKGSVRAENTNPDKDPNGQQHSGKQEGKEFLNDEEMAQALEALRNLAGVKEANLKIELVTREKVRFVIVSDPLGKVIRRIAEKELWPLVVQDKEKATGHLLDKSG